MTLRELYNQLNEKYGRINARDTVDVFTDKGSVHTYIEFYESYFKPFQKKVSLLEIGLMTGGSLYLWKNYFTKFKLVGLDITKTWSSARPFQAEVENDPDIKLCFGIDSTDTVEIPNLNDQKFDFIIDDGNHRRASQLATFTNYYPMLETGGTYFIEDIEGDMGELFTIIEKLGILSNDEYRITIYVGDVQKRKDDQILAITKLKPSASYATTYARQILQYKKK